MPYSPTKARRLGCIALLTLIVGFLVSGFTWMIGGPYTSTLPRPFNSASWKADTDGSSRCGMLTDLTWRVGVEGRSRAELVQMLGEPDDKDDDPKSSYWLLCPSFLDVYVLEVRWDKDRAVEAFTRDT